MKLLKRYPVSAAISAASVLGIGLAAMNLYSDTIGSSRDTPKEHFGRSAAVAPAETCLPRSREGDPSAAPVQGQEQKTEPKPETKPAEAAMPALEITKVSSPNYRDANRKEVKEIVLHTTESSFNSALSWLTNPKSNVSSHYLVSKDGAVVQLVDDEDIAWHARKHNSYSIGIEMEGSYARTITERQAETVGRLVMQLEKKYGISPDNVVSHSSVDPARRKDPGEQNMKIIQDYINSHSQTQGGNVTKPQSPQSSRLLKVFPGFEDSLYSEYDSKIMEYTAHWNREFRDAEDFTPLDPDLAKAMSIKESGGDKDAYRNNPMQVTPESLEFYAGDVGKMDADKSIYYGIKILFDKACIRHRETVVDEKSPVLTYKVTEGDNLWSIAKRFGTTTKDISMRSGIKNPNALSIGQYLKFKPVHEIETRKMRPWLEAVDAYNGGGTPGYSGKVFALYGSAK